MTKQRYLNLTVMEGGSYFNNPLTEIPVMVTYQILEADLMSRNVKLPAKEFVCDLDSLAHQVSVALLESKRLFHKHAQPETLPKTGFLYKCTYCKSVSKIQYSITGILEDGTNLWCTVCRKPTTINLTPTFSRK